MRIHWVFWMVMLVGGIPAAIAGDSGSVTTAPPMMRGDTTYTGNGWTVNPLFTVGETLNGYTPPGQLDGIGAFQSGHRTIRILVNHEMDAQDSYPYPLANGTPLLGSRISFFDIDRTQHHITKSGLAYHTVFDRKGNKVTQPRQINELPSSDPNSRVYGFNNFCSAHGFQKGQYGFQDNIYFLGEESSATFGHPHGGTVWALDVKEKVLHALPDLGRGAWENVTALDTGRENSVALLLGDDLAESPLYLYLGQRKPDGNLLERNGLKGGQLFVWKDNGGATSPEQFHGTGSARSGTFLPISAKDTAQSGKPGYDEQGYLDDTTLRKSAQNLGAFRFSRPEDLATHPKNGTRAAFTSTGRGKIFPADQWGAIYQVDGDFSDINHPSAKLTILYDGDDPQNRDAGIRNPDNLDWADDGFIYVQEDRATQPENLFGNTSGIEASIWQLNPVTGQTLRIVEIDRSSVLPKNASDSKSGEIGAWESSGILDITHLLASEGKARWLIATVQAHGIRDGDIARRKLDQGGQLILLSHPQN